MENLIDCSNTYKKSLQYQIFNKEFINRMLCFYKEEYLYLNEVVCLQDEFHFRFEKFHYPYFKNEVKHLTREQTIVFLTQATYFWGLIYKEFDYTWDYPAEKFYDYIEKEKMGFTDINIKYKKMTPNRDNTILVFRNIKLRDLFGRKFGEITFELETYCIGTLKFFIDL